MSEAQGRVKFGGFALSRKVDERIVIDVPGHGQIYVAVGYIDHDKVKLVTLAPPQIKVEREEVYQKRQGSDGK